MKTVKCIKDLYTTGRKAIIDENTKKSIIIKVSNADYEILDKNLEYVRLKSLTASLFIFTIALEDFYEYFR